VEVRPYMPSGIMDAAVAAAVPTRGYSVRWTGTLRAPFAGDYIFGARGGRGATVFLDDKQAVGDNSTTGMGRVREAHTQLEAGHDYKLRVEYRQTGPAGGTQIVWIPPAAPLLAEAVSAVKSADIAVAFVGLNPSLEGEEMQVNIPGFAGGDRTDLNLPEPQERLIEAAVATGKPVVVVLTSGSALAANYVAEHAAAVLEAWYGGEEIGTAIAETLTGANNPSGRLPVTFYRSVSQLPPFDDYSMKGRTYRYFKDEPLFGFGFGLSYSTFEYSGLRAQRTAKGARILVRVKNHSARDGDEVAQLYTDGGGAADDPIRQLRGFQRVHLRAGETRDVEFALDAADLPKGKVKISVGGGQPTGKVARVEGVL
jgi:beta-glucosidase